MAKTYKCQYCEKRFIRKDLINHIENKHEEMIPEGFSASRLVYNQVNKVSYGKCRVCGKETTWNEKAGRYNVLCSNPKCKEHMREEYKKNMLRVKGTYNILNDPEQQKKMLANRSISGKYKFTTDGGELTYTGSYEKKCLEFMDVVMQIPSTDILSPGPTLEYEYNGEKHFYITDFYYIPYNLIIEVKDGGDNPNNKKSVGMISSREKTIEKEHLITDKGEYNYIRLTNNNFAQLIEIFMVIKEKLLEGDVSKTYKINESVLLETSDRSTLSKNFKSKTPDFTYKLMNIKDKRAFKYLKDGKVFDDYYSNDNILNISNEDEYFRYFVNGEGKKNDGTNNVAREGELLIDTTYDKLIGYFTVEKESKFLSLVIPDKKYRGYGFGKMMTKDSIQKYGCKELWVAKDNKIAIKLYKDIGFEIIDDNRYKDWYHMKINNTIKESVILESNNEFKNETELLNWMKNNIRYEHNDSSWKLKSYEEVLQTKSGDCHDQSLFEYTVFNRQNIKCGRLFIIEYYGDKIHDAGATHTMCYFIKNNKYYWFENAWDNKRGIHGPYSNLNELKEDIYVNWEFSGKNDRLYICNLSGVKPGMDLEEYVTTALDTLIPKKYYNKNIQESAINESTGYDKYSKDIHKIIDSLSEEESNHIGNGYWVDSNHVIYRKVEYIDNEPVGFIDIYRLPKFDKRIGLVVIAVSEKARGKGIGRKLVNEAIFTCKENKDVYKLRWKADSDNTASINMAKSLGFKLIDENKNEKIFMYDLKESSINETYINTYNTGTISFMTEAYVDYISRKYKSDVTTINLRFVHSTNAIQAIKSKCKYRIYNNDYIVIDIGYNVYVVDDVVYNRVPQDVTYNSFLKFHLTKVILSRYMKDENERLINAIATYESGVYAESHKVFKSSQIKDAEIYARYLNKYGSDAVVDNLYRRGHTQYPIFEACKDVNEARKFLQDVDKISQKYNANFFIVTDGASMTRNGRGESNPAVKNARDSQIDWENKNGGDPDEDWLKDKVKESTDIFNFIEE